MNFFGSSEKISTLLVDIGSTSIACAITHYEKGKNPTLDFSVRLPFTKSIHGDEKSIETQMLITLEEVLALVFQSGFNKSKSKTKNINTVLVGLSSLWFTSYLKTVHLEEKSPIRLTNLKINELIQKEKNNFSNELKDTYKEQTEIFESNILGVSANGYQIENWANKSADSFDITLILSAAPKKLIENIENKIIGVFGTKRGISINSINSLLSKLIFRSFKNIHSALLVDISGNTTSLLSIHDGVVQTNRNLSFGIASLVQNISDNLLIPLQIAESALSLYSKGVLNDESMGELNKVFSESEDEWSLHGALLKGDGSISTPQNIFLVSDTPYAEIGRAILKDIFPGKEVIILDCQNGFLKECIKSEGGNSADGHLAVLGTYSQFLY